MAKKVILFEFDCASMSNIAVVVLDTLRRDYFDEYFDWLPGKRYKNAYSTANWTIPAHASLFTGQYASEVGVTSKSPRLNTESSVLAELLQEDGYMTRCLSTNPNLGSHWDWDRGFETFKSRNSFVQQEGVRVMDWNAFAARHQDSGYEKYLHAILETVTGDHDTLASIKAGFHRMSGHSRLVKNVPDEGSQNLLRQLKQTDFGSDEFLFINLMDAHTPYDPPEEYNSYGGALNVVIGDALADDVDDPELLRRGYEDEVRYLSFIYQKIFDRLREEFDYIFTVSDHGEMLGEYGMWNHGYGVYPELAEIPLSIYGDGFEGESVELVSLLDVYQTILSIANIERESKGNDLTSSSKRTTSLVEFHGLMPSHHDQLARKGIDERSIREFDKPLNGIAGGESYYGFETHENGFQEINDAPFDDPERVLQREIDTLSKSGETRHEEISDDLLEQLEDLGYA